MYFDMTNFIMKTLKGMIGKYPDFQVREYALNWHSRGKLTEENLAEIDATIEMQYVTAEVPDTEEVNEESSEESA